MNVPDDKDHTLQMSDRQLLYRLMIWYALYTSLMTLQDCTHLFPHPILPSLNLHHYCDQAPLCLLILALLMRMAPISLFKAYANQSQLCTPLCSLISLQPVLSHHCHSCFHCRPFLQRMAGQALSG